jgi:hypothetical protein
MAKQTSEALSRIDAFLPVYDFRAAYEIGIKAPPAVVYECLLRSDFSEVWLARLLMTLRTGRWMPRPQTPRGLRQRMHGTGFVILEEIPDDELVIGVAGRFWRPDGGRCMDLTAAEFVEFARPGYAKVAWNFKLRAESPESGRTIVSTETRIECFSRAALWKFGAYWSVVGPF